MAAPPTLNRRDLFRLGAFTAAAAGAAALVAPAIAQDPTPPPPTNPWRLLVNIPGAPETSKTALGVEMDPLEVEVRAHGRVFGPGAAHWGAARFTGRLTSGAGKELQTWFDDTLDGRNRGRKIRKNIAIVFTADKGGKRTFTLIGSFPTGFSYVDVAAEGNSGAVMHWTLEVRVDRIEMA